MNSLLDGSKRKLMVIEDFMVEADQSASKLFTKGSHHPNVSIIYVSPNLFVKGKENRTIILNTHYLILFKNLRDMSQIVILGPQIYPINSQYFNESFKDATQKPHNYLSINLKQSLPTSFALNQAFSSIPVLPFT